MKIGSLYLVKKYYWFLFSSKETADLVAPGAYGVHRPAADHVARLADYWSKRFNCAVTYLSDKDLIVFLEKDGKFKKVLTTDGKIGWIIFTDRYNDCFEEVKN